MTDALPKSASDERPRFEFTIPDKDRLYANDPRSLTLVPLRISDELQAGAVAKKAKGDTDMALTNELIRRSVVAVDGKAVDWASATAAEWLEQASPKVRARARQAYAYVHLTDDAEVTEGAGFLDSVKTSGG